MLVATYNVNVNVNKKFSDCQLIACQSVTFQSLSLLDGKQMHRRGQHQLLLPSCNQELLMNSRCQKILLKPESRIIIHISNVVNNFILEKLRKRDEFNFYQKCWKNQ